MSKLKKGNEPDKYDRIRDYILNDAEISPTDRALAKAAAKVYPILVEQMTMKDSIAKLIELGLSRNETHAVKLIHDTEKIYGRVYESDRSGRKSILMEIAWDALREAKEKAKDTGNYNPVEKLIDRIAKLGGFYETAENITQIYQQLTLPTPNISADPSVVAGDQTIEIDAD